MGVRRHWRELSCHNRIAQLRGRYEDGCLGVICMAPPAVFCILNSPFVFPVSPAIRSVLWSTVSDPSPPFGDNRKNAYRDFQMRRTRPSLQPNSLPQLRFCSRSLLVALVVASAIACGGNSTGVEAPTITTTLLAEGVVGVAYADTLEAAGGDGEYVWAVSPSLAV